MQTILGIETSCDETAAAVVVDGRQVLSNCLYSQIDIHKKFGGVVPEVAARQHLEVLNFVIDQAIEQAKVKPANLHAIAFTAGPGLVGTLLAGAIAAKTLAWTYDLPLLSVDHLLAHIAANFINTVLEPPFLALLVSGGHTQIIFFTSYCDYKILGTTLDDAAGEAYDKVGRLLGLDYPGGAAIDKLAQIGNPQAFDFPQAKVPGLNFSFSGLKTAVLRTVEKLQPPIPTQDLAASFQHACVESLVSKVLKAQKETQAPFIVLAGGVAANKTLRTCLLKKSCVPVYFPDLSYCTDNAAMVAAAAYYYGRPTDLSVKVYSRQNATTKDF